MATGHIIKHMTTQNVTIAEGVGSRLREERNRLGLTQGQFAGLAGIQKLAQSQYESGVREPRVSYLAAIGAAGANLYYILFGKGTPVAAVPASVQRDIEKRAFNLIEEYVQAQGEGNLSAESRFVLFEVLRGHLLRAHLSGTNVDLDSIGFMPFPGKEGNG